MYSDETQLAVCIGTFDNSGLPITIAKHLSDYVAVTFQTISMHMLVSRSLELGTAITAYAKYQNGSVIRVERNAKGFTAYLEEFSNSVPLSTYTVTA